MARVQLNLPEDLWKQVRAKAFADGMSASDLTKIALMQFVRYHPEKTARAINDPAVETPVTFIDPGTNATPRDVDKAFTEFRPVPKTGKTK